jgi:hypothetical protein
MQLTTEFEYAIITFLSEPHLCFNAFVTAVLMSLINHYKRPDNPAISTGVLSDLVKTTTMNRTAKRSTMARPCNLPLHKCVGSYKETGRQTNKQIDSTIQRCAVRLSTKHNNRQSYVLANRKA